MADGSIKFDIEILDKRSKQKLDELEQAIKSGGDSIDDELSNKAYDFINKWNNAQSNYESTMKRMKYVTDELGDSLESLKISQSLGDTEGIQKLTPYIQTLQAEQTKLSGQAQTYAVQMDKAGIGASKITQEINKATTNTTKQNTLLSGISGLATKTTTSFKQWVSELGKVDTNAKKASGSARNIGKSFSSSLRSVRNIAFAMLGMHGVVTALNKITRQWYESNNAGALQAKSNMNAMTSGLVNLLSPALSFVTGLMATLFGYINAIAKAFFGINLLAGVTGKNTGKIAGNAKKAKKEIQGWTGAFDKADVASEKIADNLDGAGGGGGVDLPEQNIKTPDLSGLKKSLEEAFKPFIDTMKSLDFEPLKESLRGLADVGSETFSILGNSIVRMTNETLAPFIKLMVEDIVPKGINTFTRVLKRLNPVVDKLLKTFIEPLFKWFMLNFVPKGLELVFSAFEAISGILTVVIASFNEFWNSAIGQAIAFVWGEAIVIIFETMKAIIDEVVSSIDYFLLKLEEGDPLAKNLATALGLIISALIAYEIYMKAINVATTIFNAISPFGKIVLAISAVIAIILVLYKNWDNIMKFMTDTIGAVGQWIGSKWEGIKTGFDNMAKAIGGWWNGLIESFMTGWNRFLDIGRNSIEGIKNLFNLMKQSVVGYIRLIGEFWGSIITGMANGIGNIVGNIKGIFSGLVDFIAGVFTGNLSRAWQGVVNVFSNIVSGIANIFKWPINAMIDGINVFIRGINRIRIPSWVPGIGGAGFNIGQLPRLANGAVLTHQTTAVMAEYPNARTNPELVTPEKKMRQVFNEEMSKIGTVGSSQPTYVINKIYLDGKQIKETVNELNEEENFNTNGGGFAWNM